MMSASEIYLDNNASTQPLPEVCEAVHAALDTCFGNPSSSTSRGDHARHLLESSRDHTAELIGSRSTQITFTSGGTEANNQVLWSTLRHKTSGTAKLVTSQVEHSSILAYASRLEVEDMEVEYIGVDREGLIDLNALDAATRHGALLVSVQWVNNETGVIQPIDQIGALCRERSVLFHTDAAQAVGKLPIDISKHPIDFLTFTAHKLHGPQGVGALYAANPDLIRSMFAGGEQENGRRPGTENLSGIAGFGAAATRRHKHMGSIVPKLSSLRDAFEDRLVNRLPGVRVNGCTGRRVCNTSNICFDDIDGQILVARLDQEGVICSQSSACTNRRPEPSYVLRAMGLTETEAYSSVRFGFSELNTLEEIEIAVDKIATLCEEQWHLLGRKHTNSHPLVEAD